MGKHLYKNQAGELYTGGAYEDENNSGLAPIGEPDLTCSDGVAVSYVGEFGQPGWLVEVYQHLHDSIVELSSLERQERDAMANRDSARIDRDNFIDAMQTAAREREWEDEYNRFASEGDGNDPMPQLLRKYNIRVIVEAADADEIEEALTEALSDYPYNITEFNEVTE